MATYGQSVRNAVTMGVDDITAGGINGRKISLAILMTKVTLQKQLKQPAG